MVTPSASVAPTGHLQSASTALLTDHYELTMLQAALRSGEAHRRCVFETFTRRLPEGRRYAVLAGTGRFLDALEQFRFGEAEIADLRARKVVDEETCDWLAAYRFTGDISGYAEGECFFPGSPVLVVEASFAEGVLLETLALSILNHAMAYRRPARRRTLSPCCTTANAKPSQPNSPRSAPAPPCSSTPTTS